MTTKPTIGANHIDGDIITATNWNNDVVAQALYVDEVLGGTNADKIPSTAISGIVGAYPNLLVNGGAEIWQRGAGAFNANNSGVLTADRWLAVTNATSNLSVTRATGVGTGSQYGLGAGVTIVSAASVYFRQNVENFAECRGRRVYLQGQCSVPAGGSCFAQLYDNVSANNSTPPMTATGLNTFTTFLDVSASASFLSVFLYMTVGGNYVWDNMMLCLSGAAVAYQPRPYAEEMALCNRYYQQIRVSARWRAMVASQGNDFPIFYKAGMPGVPTITRTAGTPVNIASSNFPAGSFTADGAVIEYVSTAGTATTGTDTSITNDLVTLEYNV